MSEQPHSAEIGLTREGVARALWETFFYKPSQDEGAWEALRPAYLAKADEFLARVTPPVECDCEHRPIPPGETEAP